MSVTTECGAVEPGVREGVDDLVAGAAEELRRHGGRSDAHEQHMVEPRTRERVFLREHAVDFVGFDDGAEEIAD